MLDNLEQAADTAPAIAPRLRIVALLNGSAGAFSPKLATSVTDQLEQAFAAHGVEVELKLLKGDDLRAVAESDLARAKSGELDAIVVGGGDGTIRTVASVLADSGIPLGVLPLGTLNHFAKDLGIPLDVAGAVETIVRGTIQSIDLAEVNGEVFINNSSIGIYPYMVIDRERLRAKHKLRKWIAAVPAFIRMTRHFPRRRLRIRAETWTRPFRTPCLFVGNNRYPTNLFAFGRRERLDQGELWLYVVKPRSPLGFFWMVCRMCIGKMDEARDLVSFQLQEAEIGARSSRLPVAIDGEVEIMRTPLNYRSRPGALCVIVPAANPAATADKTTST